MVQNKGNTSKLYIILTVSAFLQVAVILMSNSIGYAQSSQAITANREAYVRHAVLALPDLFIRINSQHKEFRQQLTAEESAQYDLLLNLLNEKIFHARLNFKGGQVYELFESFGLKYDFSSNSQDFILPDGKPERSAKTNSDWATPIVFNKNILNNINSQIGLLDILQILVHELGHKLGDKKNQTAIDQLSAKLKSFLMRFYSVDFNKKGEQIEVLSFPGDAKEIKISNELGLIDLTSGLIFFSDSQKKTELVSDSFRLKKDIGDIKRLNSHGYNLIDNSNFRIVGVKIYSEKLPIPEISFVVDCVSQTSYTDGHVNFFNLKNGLHDGPMMYPVMQAESYRMTVSYSYDYIPHTDFSSIGKFNYNIYAMKTAPKKEMRQAGVIKDIELSIDQSQESNIKIYIRSKEGQLKEQTDLVVRGNNTKIYLKPSRMENNNGFDYITYNLTISKDVPRQTIEISGLANKETHQEVALAKPLTFQAGFKSMEENPTIGFIKYVFYNEGNGWKVFDEKVITSIASLEPGFAFSVSANFKVREIRIIWKKGASILYNNEEAGLVSGFETEVFRENDFAEIHQKEKHLIMVKSKKFSVPLDPVSLIDFFQIEDNGLREIKEVILIGQDLTTSSRLVLPYDRFYKEHHIQAPKAMIDEVRQKLKSTKNENSSNLFKDMNRSKNNYNFSSINNRCEKIYFNKR